MKIKSVFLAFNIIIVFSFLFVFFMPVFFLGWEVSRLFWRENWYVAIVFVAVLAGLNTYLVISWPLFGALEKQDWPRVVAILERRVLEKGRATRQNVRLLVNGYLLLSRTDEVMELERYLRVGHERVLRTLSLLFGIPHLLSNDGVEIERYYESFRSSTRGQTHEWVAWHVGFALLLQEKVDDGLRVLSELAVTCRDDLVAALALHLVLPLTGEDGNNREALEARRMALRDAYPPEAWERMVESRNDELHVLVLSRLFDDVRQSVLA